MNDGNDRILSASSYRTDNDSYLMMIQEKLKSFYKSPLTGLLFSALSGICFTMSNFMVQFTTTLFRKDCPKIASMQMVIVRCAVQLLFIFPFQIVLKIKFFKNWKDLVYIIPMGIAGFVNIVFMYLSLERIPISDALLISFTSPFFCAIFSKILLNESLHWITSIAGILSFTGVITVARPSLIFGGEGSRRETLLKIKHPVDSERVYLFGVFFALLSAVFLAIYFVLIRKLVLHKQLHVILTFIYPSLFGVIVTYVLIRAQDKVIYIPKTFNDMVLMLSIGVYSIVALVFLALALKIQNATVVNLIRNLDVVYAFSLQYAVFDIKPNPWNVSGGMIIIIGTSIVVVREYFQSKHVKKDVHDEVSTMKSSSTDLTLK